MLDLEEAVAGWVGSTHGLVPDVFAGLDLLGVVVEVAGCVEVEVDGVVAEGCEDVLAVFFADGIWGSGGLG